MLIDAVKAALWGMALLVHCLLLLLLMTRAEWAQLPWWTWLPWRDEFFLTTQTIHTFEGVDNRDGFYATLPKGMLTLEWPGTTRENARAGLIHRLETLHDPNQPMSTPTSRAMQHGLEGGLPAPARDAIASYRRWLALWKVCKVTVRITAVFLLLVLVRALWLGATPYLPLIILLAPIAVLLNMPYYIIMHHEFSTRVNVWESFPYWALGAVVIIFAGWPPLLVTLRKRQQSLWRMVLAVCLPGSRAGLRNKGDTYRQSEKDS